MLRTRERSWRRLWSVWLSNSGGGIKKASASRAVSFADCLRVEDMHVWSTLRVCPIWERKAPSGARECLSGLYLNHVANF